MAPTLCSTLFVVATCLAISCWAIVGADAEQYVPPFAYNIPITYRINQKQTECLYEKFEKGDFVTFSAFVLEALNNGPPKASIKFEGPVAGNEEAIRKIREVDPAFTPANEDNPWHSFGRELRNGVNGWEKIKDSDRNVRYDKRMGLINRQVKVDWTHAGEHEDAVSARAQIESEKKEAYRNYGRGAPRPDLEEQNEKFRTVTQQKIEPFEETNAIKAAGWYRMCVSAELHGLMVEMDIRSGTKMGGVDRTTGHVYTHEAREMREEEKVIEEGITTNEERSMDANTYATIDEETKKVIENQVKEQDLHATKSQIKHLNMMVLEMKKKQHDLHHRIKMHSATAQRNHNSMVWSGKLETVLYVVLTGLQIYTVRKWLLSNNMLGSFA